MGATNIREISYPLPSRHLEQANWADCFEVKSSEAGMDATVAVARIFDAPLPRWVRTLTSLRNKIVGLVGLEGGEISIDGEKLGAFPILYRGPDAVVCGFDDWHLDFRVVVETPKNGADQRVRLATLVRRKHWFGYVYLFLITPFHKAIARTLLLRAAQP